MGGEWGLSMAGCEQVIRQAVRAALASTSDMVRYLEIGTARGDTFARICEQLDASGQLWEAFALDLPMGFEEAEGYVRQASCLDLEAFDANTACFNGKARLVLCDSQLWLRRPGVPSPFALALIDGCHERTCAADDFVALESFMGPRAVVIFHDTAAWSQDDPTQSQPHRGQPLQVRAALDDLGLLYGTRPGWGLLAEAFGRESEGGRGCMVFQRTEADACS